MNARASHPTLDDWLRWLDHAMPAPERGEFERHLGDCRRCDGDLGFLRGVRSARRMPHWEMPPDTLRRRVRRRPTVPQAPAPSRASKALAWAASDIRGDGSFTAEGRHIARVFPEAELGIMATPPGSDGLWTLEGRVWLRRPSDEPIRVSLMVDSHVLACAGVSDGEYFEFAELLSPGWRLELRLPDGKTLVLDDPHA